MDYTAILFEEVDGVATITFNRPDRMNAFSTTLITEFKHALERVESEGTARALLLTGKGRAFSAGADLDEVNEIPPETRDMGARLEALLNPLIERLRAFPVPVVAAVNGAAAGGGLGFALAADIVVAARSAYFLSPFSKIGLVPDCGTTWLLPRLVGKARATGMMLLGQRVPAEQAEAWGLIWQAVDDDRLMEVAGGIAAELAAGPTLTLAAARKAIAASLETGLTESMDLERRNQQACGKTRDHLEGVAAFQAKRKPVFTGK